MTPLVYIIVLNWNGWRDTVGCLSSLKKLDYPNFEILAIDNGSQDGSEARIREYHPDVTLLQTGENLGYGGGNNVGIRYALERGADYVWVLNNDTLVEPATLAALVDAARLRDRVGAVGTVAVTQTGSGVREAERQAFRWRGERLVPVLCSTPGAQPEGRTLLVDSVSGNGALLSATMLRQTGAFDERFFHYYEDFELCERARSAGWAIVYACRSRFWHEPGSSLSNFSPQARYYYIRNWLLFSRWSGRGGLVKLLRRNPVWTVGRISGARWLLKGRWRVAVAGMLGAFDALRGRYGKRDPSGWITRAVLMGFRGRP